MSDDAYRVLITKIAKKEVREIANYFSLLQPGLGARFVRLMRESSDSLGIFPRRNGQRYDTFRCVPVSKHRSHLIWYTIDEAAMTVTIHHVIHSSRGDVFGLLEETLSE